MPYYVRPSEAGIVAHFRAVADASPVPVVLYNVAFRTGRHLSAAGVLEAAAHPNIVGIKQAAAGLDLDTLELLAGAAPTSRCSAARTRSSSRSCSWVARGAICASAHVCTERSSSMIECGLAGKVDEGRAHAEALLPVVKSLFVGAEPGGVQGRAARAGPDPDARRAPAAPERGPESVAATLAAVHAALVALATKPVSVARSNTKRLRFGTDAVAGQPTGTREQP